MRIIEYKIVCENFSEFEPSVNRMIGQGWQPFGGVAATKPFDEEEPYALWQAMVKYEKQPRKRK